jgi:hypothetical protein
MSAPQPAKGPPQRIVLEGRYVRLEPLAERHVPSLFDAASAPGADERFRYLSNGAPQSESDMGAWVELAAARDDPLMFAVLDRQTREPARRPRRSTSLRAMSSTTSATAGSSGSATRSTRRAAAPPSASASPTRASSAST